MVTKKITLNELRTLVKQIIKEEQNADEQIIKKYGKQIGMTYTASLPAELKGGDVSDTNIRIETKVKLLGMENYGQDGNFAVQMLDNYTFTDPANKQRYAYKKGERHIVQPKYIK